MCKLKHPFVAAAMICLATQIHAGYFPGSTDFEGNPLADADYWSNAASAEIVPDATVSSLAQSPNRPSDFNDSIRTNVLSVDSSTPVACNLNAGGAAPTDSTIYADVLIKGTPLAYAAAAPEAGESDKILVYTRVSQDGTATNLCVLAKPDANSLTNEFVLTKSIGKDEWHRLVIVAKDNGTYQIYCDGVAPANLCKTSGDVDTFYAINSGAAMTSVAFQGTGSVDDLILSTFSPDQPVYTLTWGGGFDSVSYTVNGIAGDPLTPADGEYLFQAPQNALVALTGVIGHRTNMVDNSSSSLDVELNPTGISKYFPQSATPGQDGTAEHPYEIPDIAALNALKGAVATGASGVHVYVQTADIDFANATFEGIGTYADNPTNGVFFAGTYDGQSHKISNVTFTDRDYAGIFNQVNGGTIQNLTVSNLTFVGTGEKYSASIVGNAGNGATLQNLVAEGSFGSAGKPGNHNMAGIAIRLSGGGAGTLVKDCTNNAAIYGTYTKLAGICAITQEKVNGGPVTFDGCVNNGNLTMPSGDTAGRDGLAGIVGYVSDDTVLKDCQNTDSCTMTSTYADAKIGQLVGCANDHSLTDQGGNKAFYVRKMIGHYGSSTVANFRYATVSGGVATTVTALSKNRGYMLEANIPASETPVMTLTVAEDYIMFDTVLGYTFAGTVAAAEGLEISEQTSDTITTYTAKRTGPPSFKDPEGRDIEDPAVLDWLAGNGFTQADINALGNDSAATDKLYECYLLNCDFTVQDAGGSLSISAFTASTNVAVTVRLVRKTPLGVGVIKGKLYFYGANDLAAGFSRSPIADESVDFRDNPYFHTGEPGGCVTQAVTAVLSDISYKFFKAAIEPVRPDPEPDPEPEPEPDPEPEE